MNKEDEKVSFGGLQVLALKELREIVEILDTLFSVFDTLPENSKMIVKQKINTILIGSPYMINEGGNTGARNFEFEFRLAFRLIESGYEIAFFENPDIAVQVKERKYAIECKRITGISPRAVQTNLNEAIDQLIEHKDNYYGGIVALDVSALLDRRKNLLKSTSRDNAGNKVLNDMQAMLLADSQRCQKLRKYSHTHLVALIYDFSGSYVIPNDNEVGWTQGTDVLSFLKENPNKSKRFNEDFANYRKYYISR